jgi:choline-sulfatase
MYSAIIGISDNEATVSPAELNFENVLNDADYDVYFKGKFHMNSDFTAFSASWGDDPVSAPSVAKSEDKTMQELYNINGWTSPGFGTSLVSSGPTPSDAATMAGGSGHNDNRVVTSEYSTYPRQQSVLEFLKDVQENKPERPFCLVVSLLNPHAWKDAGYETALFRHYDNFELPKSYHLHDLSTKPECQAAYLKYEFKGKLVGTDALNYVKFYAYLHTLSDRLHQQVFDAIGAELMNNAVLVRMADHGEMGMAHGGVQEKNFTAYNETQQVPMFFYHPTAFPPGTREQLTSLIDVVPTLGRLAGADMTKFPQLQGVHFTKALFNPEAETQASLLFNYPNGGNGPPAGSPHADANSITPLISTVVPTEALPTNYPCNIYSILTDSGWKYAVYYDLDTNKDVVWSTAQFELYNLNEDRDEICNL